MTRWLLLLVVGCWLAPSAQAGLYYSGEPIAPLPASWQGYLLDQRLLRSIAIKPSAGNPASPARVQYLDEAAKLEKIAQTRPLTADENADLGALLLRLNEVGKAVDLLRQAQRKHPNHFAIAANLGTAWQLHGELPQALLSLQQAVRLAPGKLQQHEEYHLKLVRLRLREPAGTQTLDDLFGVRYGGEGKEYQPGKLTEAEFKKLPANAVGIVQLLGLWLPHDGRLLWQLAELANAHGDIRFAAGMLEGCVSHFGLSDRDLRQRRQLLRELAKLPTKAGDPMQMHVGHSGGLVARSPRPLLLKVNQAALPAISATSVNGVPWALLTETAVDRPFRPQFAKYLQELDGKLITLTGFIQPLRDDTELGAFLLIEYPVGCWYCEMPPLNGMLFVELPRGQTTSHTRALVRVTGRLTLNRDDPEEFLYKLRDARVGGVD